MEKIEIKIHPDNLKELVVDGQKFWSSLDFRLTEGELEKARKEQRETEDVRKSSLRQMKDLLQGDTEFRYRTDDAYLLRYLRHKKFRVKEAYQFMRNFYRTRRDSPELFLIPAELERLLDSQFCTLMPYTDEGGHVIFLLKWAKWNTSERSVCDLVKILTSVGEIISMNPRCQVNGIIEIWDFSGSNMIHWTQLLLPSNLRMWTKAVQEFYPWKVRRVVILNCNAFLYAAFATVRLFLKKKIVDRITLLRSDLSQLHECVNPTVLPKEYGGKLEDSECHSFLKRPMLDNLQYLKAEAAASDLPCL